MKLLVVFVIAALLFVGCGSKQKSAAITEESEKPLSAHGTMAEPQTAAKVNALQGKVLERLDAAGYSYLRLSTSTGEVWAAVPQTEVKVGEEVSMGNPMPMDGFETKTLNRKFDRIYFGTLQQPQEADPARVMQTAHSSGSESAVTEPIKVKRAMGSEGRTIAEIFAQKTQLKDRNVAVTGKVVKVNANIMGKNWIHLRDGSGDPASKTNDLTVTTKASAAVGETVMVKGKIRTEIKTGMGYVFPVIIEDADITKQ